MSRTDCTGKHVCEPDHFPTSLDEEWTCPECAVQHIAFRVGDLIRSVSGVTPDTIGWRSTKNGC